MAEKKYIYGFDLSTSKCGIAVLQDDNTLIHNEFLKFKNDSALEERAFIFDTKIKNLFNLYPPHKIYVENPLVMFKANMSMAQTIAKLNIFFGMCTYILYNNSSISPMLVNVRSARTKLGIKADKDAWGKASKKDRQRLTKKAVIDYIIKKFANFEYKETKQGNPAPGIDDKADAVVLALQAFN